ncbi:MGMT family protein [Parafrankia elaeagni]|uniref:MGMT family protein n=1 Tax=Parafrankia elaeagni TaxID=222534 RepID=UPI0003649DA3|nr:MGMT family protein [Parafrankia elaeagni]
MVTPEIALAEGIAEALRVYAEAKRAALTRQHPARDQAPAEIGNIALPTGRGPRQQEIAEILLIATEEGMKTAEVARLVGMEQPNAYLTLQALQKQGIVEMVSTTPQRWRLAALYRQRHQILRAAELVGPGEFTTYGDISQVVYGHSRGGQAVGRVANTATDFPHPHRVLTKGGAIPTGWIRPDGTGSPDEAAVLLRGEGIEVLTDQAGKYYAHPRHYIDADELTRRMSEAAGTGVPGAA